MNWFTRWFSDESEIASDMKYLIVGLGNMGTEYDNTRHNIGFDVVDAIASDKNVKWKHENLGDVCKVKNRGRTLVLLKPSTYMNRSGKAVRYWLQKEKISMGNLLVIVDDLNIDFGKIRLRGKGSDGGHNGLKDINELLGSNYARIRVGIGDTFGRGKQIDFVLGKWDDQELKELPAIINKSSDTSLSFTFSGLNQTMNRFN